MVTYTFTPTGQVLCTLVRRSAPNSLNFEFESLGRMVDAIKLLQMLEMNNLIEYPFCGEQRLMTCGDLLGLLEHKDAHFTFGEGRIDT